MSLFPGYFRGTGKPADLSAGFLYFSVFIESDVFSQEEGMEFRLRKGRHSYVFIGNIRLAFNPAALKLFEQELFYLSINRLNRKNFY